MRQTLQVSSGYPDNRKWLRRLVPPTLLLLSAGLAYMLPRGREALVLLAIGPVVAGLLMYLRQPALGILALIAAGMVVPLELGTDTGTGLNSVVLLVPILTGLWLLDSIIRGDGIHIHRHRAVTLLLGLSGVAALSFVVGQLPWFSLRGVSFSAQMGGLMVFLLSAAAFLVSAHILNEQWLERLVYLFLAIGAVYLVSRITPALAGPISRIVVVGALGSLFWTWTVSLSGALALFDVGLTPRMRGAFVVLCGLALVVALVVNRSWASGWAPAGLALLALITLHNRRLGLILSLLAAAVFILRFEQAMAIATDTDSWAARRQAWQIVLDTTSVNPILGLGPANYYSYVERASISGWGGNWNVRFSSHNNYVDLIAQTGIVGLLLFLGFAYAMGRVGLDLFRRPANGFVRAYAAACLAGMTGTLASGMLGDWFLPFVYNIGLGGMRASILFWVFMGGLLMLWVGQQRDEA